jgi:hypothetical protein
MGALRNCIWRIETYSTVEQYWNSKAGSPTQVEAETDPLFRGVEDGAASTVVSRCVAMWSCGITASQRGQAAEHGAEESTVLEVITRQPLKIK